MPIYQRSRPGFALGLAALVACASAQAAPKTSKPPAPPSVASSGCAPLPTSFNRDVAAAQKARDAAFARALAAKKLVPWRGIVAVRDTEGHQPSLTAPAPTPGGPLIDLGSVDALSKPDVELVADKRGTVFRVMRMPRGDHKMYTQCGCMPITRGGAAVAFVHFVADLPKGVSYGGTVTIAYDDTVPTASWDNMRDGQICPAPP
jgi:hypothetical protein